MRWLCYVRAYTLRSEHVPPLVVRVPRIPILPQPPARKGFFGYEEFVAPRSELPEPLRPVIAFAYNTKPWAAVATKPLV